jgi:hypothetical protein
MLLFQECICNVNAGRETEITAVGDPSHCHATPLYPQKLVLTSPTSGCRSVGIVLSWTKATELVGYL